MTRAHTPSWMTTASLAALGLGVAGLGVAGSPTRVEAQVLNKSWSKPSLATWSGTIVGDVNGDGYDDVAVRITNKTSTPGVYLYRGSPSGLETSPSWSVLAKGRKSDDFGRELAPAGDVDGDGYDDLLVGDPKAGSSPTDYEGRVYLYRGSASGLEPTASWSTTEPVDVFGFDIEGGGDVDGDGYDDDVVGAIGTDNYGGCGGGGDPSAVYVYQGSSSGLSETPDWSQRADPSGVTWKQHTSRSQGNACLGQSVSIAGDVNGDGYDDVAVVALNYRNPNRSNPRGWGEGRGFVFRGSPSGLQQTPSWSRAHPDLRANEHGGLYRVTIRGDVNGDGYDDLVMAGEGQYREPYETRQFVFHGTPSGLKTSYHQFTSYNDPIESDTRGDIDNDGYDDLVTWGGRKDLTYLFHGSDAGLVEPAADTLGPYRGHPDHNFGAFSTGGDVNGDGYDDVLIGTIQGVHLYRGGPNPAPTATAETLTVPPDTPTSLSLEASDPAGDPLTYALAERPDHGEATDVDERTGTVRYTPDGGFTGTDQLTFRVEDPFGGADEATIELEVEPDNRPPTFIPPTPTGELEATVGEPLVFELQARDPDGDTITYEVSPLPNGASLDDQQGQFRWTPPASRAGDEIEFELIADDGEAQATRRLTVIVRATPSGDAERGGRDASTCPTDTGRCGADVRDTSSTPDVASPPEADVRADAREANDVHTREPGADTSSEASAPPSDGGCRCTTSGEDEMPPVSLPLGLVVALGAIRRSSRCRENSFTSFRSSGDSSSSA